MTFDQHPLERPEIAAAVQIAVTDALGRRWIAAHFRDLGERASHRCGILSGGGFGAFVKYSDEPDAAEQFAIECAGLGLLRDCAGVRMAEPVGAGVLVVGDGALLVLEALDERAPEERTTDDWRSIGQSLAALHATTGESFGLLEMDGYFGPLRQDNRPMPGASWAEFLRDRRVMPFLAAAVDSGHLPIEFHPRVERYMDRLGEIGLNEVEPTLLHGDAQQNNFLSTDLGAVIVDASPHYGHPENDLAILSVFTPVPSDVFAAYAEIRPIDPGFDERCEIWRVPVYLAVIAVDGGNPFGRSFIGRLDNALRSIDC